MSFFGFDTNLPRDQAAAAGSSSRGMFERHDHFGGLSAPQDDGETLNFDETYDGLAQQLDESGDTFNDDTFGGGVPSTRQSLGRDFDFAGQTAAVRGDLLEEQALHHARGPAPPPGLQYTQQASSQPKRTGYEAYREPQYMAKLEADPSIWGMPTAKKPEPKQDATAGGRKMMSLEEVEAMMRSQAKPTPPVNQQQQEYDRQSQGLRDMLGVSSPGPAQQPPQQEQQTQRPMQILQRPMQQQQHPQAQHLQQQQPQHAQQPGLEHSLRAPQVQQRQQSPQHPQRPQSNDFQSQPQFVNQQQPPMGRGRGAPPVQPPQGRGPMQPLSHNRGPSYNGPPITQAQQMMSMSTGDRDSYMAEEAKRAKRNHKIFLLSKNNGLMTPQDKNFITRIQLQQLLTATGGVDDSPGKENQLAEDFYYHVYSQIRGPPRSGPGQPLNQFAQTYLFQTGSRYGYGRSRHHPRGGDNHVQRMEQQVARAVEAAKARPKNKSLVVEGSLGKIAFSNSKTPRPLLNLKRPDSASGRVPQRQPLKTADRKSALRDIEKMYSTLMKVEDHERRIPPPPNEDSPPEAIEEHMRWRSEMQQLNQQLWDSMKVMEPVQAKYATSLPYLESERKLTYSSTSHPFIQILSHGKGKKCIPRIFRHLDDQQRLTMLTLIAIHLDHLDVVRDAYPAADGAALPPLVKEEIELYLAAVQPPLFSYVNEAPLGIIIGLIGLVLERTHVQSLVRTKVGTNLLIVFLSRAEILVQGLPSAQENPDAAQWSETYNRLFDAIEPVLPAIFPPTSTSTSPENHIAAADDVHIWQFLAAMGVGASPDQQQRLVLGVKDRVMMTVGVCRTLPQEMRERREGEVNLFLRAIGLDVGLLSGQ